MATFGGRSTSERIDHVVVLMLENRSFDHMLGFLDHPGIDGLLGKSEYNNRPDGTRVPATNDGKPMGLDPDHSHYAAREQLGPGPGGKVALNGGFVTNYEKRVQTFDPKRGKWVEHASGDDVMRCLDPHTHCKGLARLALEFAVCDEWFSSVPGETWPNRNFAHAATSDSTVDIEVGFYYDPTIFEQLSKARAKWAIYYDGPPQVWCFRKLWRGYTLLDFLLRRDPRLGNWYEMQQFFDHVSSGNLRNYSFIEPAHNRIYDATRQTNSQHPGNNLSNDADFRAGETLIKNIYQALLENPRLFEKTLFLIVYDEQGGMYDHKAPPADVPPGNPVHRGLTRRIGRAVRAFFNRLHHDPPDTIEDFTRLGVRVPAVLVSPWIEPGTVLRASSFEHPFDHSSIPATLRALFSPRLRPLTKRDENAATFHAVVDTPRTSPRSNPKDPNAPQGDPHTMPDLATEDASTATRRGVAHVEERRSEDGPTELDRYLLAHAQRVHEKLRRRPVSIARRVKSRLRRAVARRPPTPVPETVEPVEAAFPFEVSPLDSFKAAAERSRKTTPPA
jgi:phospholipase C